MLILFTKRLKYLDYLLKSKSTGTPKVLSEKLGISERAWYKLRDELLEVNVPISYCKVRKTYFYEDEGSFVIGFYRLSDAKKENTSAGSNMVLFRNMRDLTDESVKKVQLNTLSQYLL